MRLSRTRAATESVWWFQDTRTFDIALAVYRVVECRRGRLVWEVADVRRKPPGVFAVPSAHRLGCRHFTAVEGGRRVTVRQAKALTGLTHPMAAMDKLRELVEEGAD